MNANLTGQQIAAVCYVFGATAMQAKLDLRDGRQYEARGHAWRARMLAEAFGDRARVTPQLVHARRIEVAA